MNRRRWLRWGCAHCAAFGGLAAAQSPALPADSGDWIAPPRFEKPDLASEEGGLWAMMDREETRLRRSVFRIRDDALSTYLTAVACKLGAAHCADIRVYPIRTPYFNASMAPNGMMQVWSGLLLRVENEAQLAAVLGHEIGHYLQRHSLERLRDIKSKAAFAQFIGMFGIVGALGALATIAGALAFSREQEREADRIGIQLMRNAGYDPREAAKVWAYLYNEAAATPGRDPASDSVLFATHPPTQERRATLETMAAGGSGETGEAAWRARVAPHRTMLLEDEIKRGRPDESVALLNRLVPHEPGNASLLHFRGEAYRLRNSEGDAVLALADYQAAVQTGLEPAVTHRAMAELYKSMNQTEPARAAWQRYLQRAPDAADAAMVRQALQEMK